MTTYAATLNCFRPNIILSSSYANWGKRELKECNQALRNNSRLNELYAELDQVYQDAQEEGWDGYKALPADISAYFLAREFLSLLSSKIPNPEISIDSDGDVSFEWYITPTKHLILNIGGNKFIDYVGIVGNNCQKGREQFVQDIPEIINGLFKRVFR